MPKRGSSTSGTVAVVPNKRQKSTQQTYSHENHDEEDSENIPMTQNYQSQALKRIPEVNHTFDYFINRNSISTNHHLASQERWIYSSH